MDRRKKRVKYLYRLREQCRISSSKKWINSIINNVCLDINIMFSYLPAPLIVKITLEVIPNFLRLFKHTLCFVMTQILSSTFFSKDFVLQNKKRGTVCVNKLLLCIRVCSFKKKWSKAEKGMSKWKKTTGLINNTFSETLRNQKTICWYLYLFKEKLCKHLRLIFAVLYLKLLKEFFLESK